MPQTQASLDRPQQLHNPFARRNLPSPVEQMQKARSMYDIKLPIKLHQLPTLVLVDAGEDVAFEKGAA